MRAIHNLFYDLTQIIGVVPNIKDINFWEQFTTYYVNGEGTLMLFRISKISTFESNSQQRASKLVIYTSCSEYQRYQLLRAIHNTIISVEYYYKLFRISKISTFESNSQHCNMLISKSYCCSEYQRYQLLRAIHNQSFLIRKLSIVVPNIKDINFWEQFTTMNEIYNHKAMLFRISKISTFESNSQLSLQVLL